MILPRTASPPPASGSPPAIARGRALLLACLVLGACADGGVADPDPPVHTDTGDVPDTDTDTDTDPPEDGRYRPDDGPTVGAGNTVVRVCSEAEILAAIAGASPGDAITICPGTFAFNQRISVARDGAADARIFLRAETPGTVRLELSHIENFNIRAKFWIFENITFAGVCTAATSCEHAFHLVADADDVIFRDNEVVDFASHVKLNGEVVGAGPAKAFPDRAWFIRNYWHNTRYIDNEAPHNILNLDGGKDHVVRGNVFADFGTRPSLARSASAVYPKASALRILVEQNLIVCEKARPDVRTTRGIQLGDGAPASICDGDTDGDGSGDCEENGQSQEAIVRNNIIVNCNNSGSSTGLMVGSDRASLLIHNTVYNVEPRNAGFYIGHPNHDTLWRRNILENGVNTGAATRPLNLDGGLEPSRAELEAMFTDPAGGDFSLAAGADALERAATDPRAPHDFCGYPRGDRTEPGAIALSTPDDGPPCAEVVQALFDRI